MVTRPRINSAPTAGGHPQLGVHQRPPAPRHRPAEVDSVPKPDHTALRQVVLLAGVSAAAMAWTYVIEQQSLSAARLPATRPAMANGN